MTDALLSDSDLGIGAPPSGTQNGPAALLSDSDVGLTQPTSLGDRIGSDVGQAGAGIIEGGTGLVGMPGDVQQMSNSLWDRAALGAIHKGFDWTGYGPQAGTPDRADFDKGWQAFNDVGSAVAGPQNLPTSSDVGAGLEKVAGPLPAPSKTIDGSFLRTAGQFLPAAMAGPEGVGKKLAYGVAAPAAGSEAAGDLTQGTAAEPYARAAGAVLGGVGAVGAGAGLAKASDIAAPVVAKGLAAVGKPAMQEGLAGQQLLKSSQDPDALRTTLSQQGPDEIVPGSKPTTFQLTGDQGIGQMERGAQTVDPAPFLQRSADQNSARLASLNAMQPTGNPEAVTAHLSDQLGQIDTDAQYQIDMAKSVAQDAVGNIGTGAGPETTGADLRAHVALANQAATAQERQLWQGVDPDGSIVNPTAAITKANTDIYGGLTPTAQAFITPAEKTFNSLISNYQSTESLQEIGDLRSNLAAAMRTEKASPTGSAVAYGRMSKLMGAVQSTIQNTIENHAAVEAGEVSQGVLSPEDTMVARMKQVWGVQNERSLNSSASLARVGNDPGGLAGAGSASSVGRIRTGRTATGGAGQAPGDPGIPAPAPQPFDAAAAERLKAASAATKSNKQAFGKGVIGQVMQSAGTAGDYRMPASTVPAKIFPAGPGGFEAVKAYTKAAGTGQAATQALETAAMENLRSRAANSLDGMLQPRLLAGWKSQYANALRALDEVSPGFSSRFDDTAKASDDVLRATAARTDAMKAFQAGSIGKLLGAQGSDEVVNRLGKIMTADDRVPQIQRLMQATQGNPDAVAGLRRAAAEWMTRRFMTETEAGTSGQKAIAPDRFKRLVSGSAPVLSQVFTPDEMANFRAVAADLDRANRSIVNKAKGSPGTAGDLNQAAKGHGGHGGGSASSLMGAIMTGAFTGHVAHGVHGAIVGASSGGGLYVLNALRHAGIHDVQGLVSDALLNPDRARQYLARVPASDNGARTTAGMLRRSFLSVPTAYRTHDDEARQLRARGGALPANASQGSIDDRNVAAGARRLFDALDKIGTDLKAKNRDADILRQLGGQDPLKFALNLARVHAAGGRVAPTDAQKEAGNYPKGHIKIAGMDISIENAKGSTRSGADATGRRWSVKMPADYGYIRGTVGADGDHVDCYVGPRPDAPYAFIIDQHDAKTGKFDEHKVMLGFASAEDALQTYVRGFSDGKGLERAAQVTRIPVTEVLKWAKSAWERHPDRRARGGGVLGAPTYSKVTQPAKRAIGFGF